jgi:uncharacterized protein (TIGR02271 family)
VPQPDGKLPPVREGDLYAEIPLKGVARPRRRAAPRPTDLPHPPARPTAALDDTQAIPVGTLKLKEEQLVPHRQTRQVGEVVVRTESEEVPARLELDADHEEVEISRVPIGRVVSERQQPWEEDGATVIPIYEEQLVVTRRLVLKEHVVIRRAVVTEHQVFEDTVRRDRLKVDDGGTGYVREVYDTAETPDPTPERDADSPGLLDSLVRRALK